jgi:hypothetical protein
MKVISKDKLFFNYLYQKRSESVNNIDDRVIHNKTKSDLMDLRGDTTENFSKKGKLYKDNIINSLKKISFRSIDSNNSKFFNNRIEDSQLPDIRKKYDEILNLTQKSMILKTSIYSNLLPVNADKENKVENKVISKKISKEEFGQFLNISTRKKHSEISSPTLKNNLETINYYGPYYSHCPSCKDRNIDFYQSMNMKDSMKLIDFLRQTRMKK